MTFELFAEHTGMNSEASLCVTDANETISMKRDYFCVFCLNAFKIRGVGASLLKDCNYRASFYYYYPQKRFSLCGTFQRKQDEITRLQEISRDKSSQEL